MTIYNNVLYSPDIPINALFGGPMKKGLLLPAFSILFFSLSFALEVPVLEKRYLNAKNRTDKAEINCILKELNQPITYEGFLLKGKCLYTLSKIAAIEGDKDTCTDCATNAIISFDSAAGFYKGSIEAIYSKLLVYQLMSELDWQKNAKYEEKIDAALKKMKTANPDSAYYKIGFSLRLIKAQTPIGGNAMEGIKQLSQYTNSTNDIELLLFIAEGYIHMKEYNKAKEIIAPILNKYPDNIWALSLSKASGE